MMLRVSVALYFIKKRSVLVSGHAPRWAWGVLVWVHGGRFLAGAVMF